MTQIGGLPVHAGKGVLHGVTGVFKRGDRDQEVVPDLPTSSGQASQPVGLSDSLDARGAAFPTTNNDNDGAPTEPGTLRVTVLDAKDLSSHDSKPYAAIRIGDKEFKTKHVHKTATPEWSVIRHRY